MAHVEDCVLGAALFRDVKRVDAMLLGVYAANKPSGVTHPMAARKDPCSSAEVFAKQLVGTYLHRSEVIDKS